MRKKIFLSLFFIGIFFCCKENIYAMTENGFVKENNQTFYYEDGQKVVGFKTIGNDVYFFSRSLDMYGVMRTGIFPVGQDYYCFGTDGKLKKGLFEYNGHRYYANADGVLQVGEQIIDGRQYFFSRSLDMYGQSRSGKLSIYDHYYIYGDDGVLLTGLFTYNGKRYYANAAGVLQVGEQIVDGRQYFFSRSLDMYGEGRSGKLSIYDQYYIYGDDGALLTGLFTYKGKRYYANADGVMQVGEQIVDGRQYFFSRSLDMYGEGRSGKLYIYDQYYIYGDDGALLTGLFTYNGKQYYANADGVMQVGEQIVDGRQYFFSRSLDMYGEGRTGKLFVYDHYYIYGDDGALLTGLFTYNGKQYYADSDGILQVGEQLVDGRQYFFSRALDMYGEGRSGKLSIYDHYYIYGDDGVLLTGLFTYKGHKYYALDDGVLQGGFHEIDGDTYFFTRVEEFYGQARVGFIDVDGKRYHLADDGKMNLGFQTINEKRYYFSSDKKTYGQMQIGWLVEGGARYYFEQDGVECFGFKDINGSRYFFSRALDIYGQMRTGWIEVDGKRYHLASDGKMDLGFTMIDNEKYFFSRDMTIYGQMRTGFITVNNYRYYLIEEEGDKKGTLVTGYRNIHGRDYMFDDWGRMHTGFVKINGKTYYYYADGTYANDWLKIGNTKYFFNSLGVMIAANAKKVIDMSAHQGIINWDDVKNYGDVDAVIVRISAGSDYEDTQLARNIAELKRLGIPYGVYIYSYAENEYEANLEADRVLNAISKYQMNLSFPIYLDLESNLYTNSFGPNQYLPIVRTFMDRMSNAGYDARIYTYVDWANKALNHSEIWNKIDWMAHYSHYCGYTGNYRGWQYSSTEKVPGINGNVDMSVFFY